MKNIYDLLNQAEDNEDILSENERMEMTDIEKRRIYNRILLDSEEGQKTADSGGLHGGDLCRWLYSGGSSKGISV